MAKDLLSKQRGDSSRLSDDGRLEAFLGEHGWRDGKEINLSKDTSLGIATPYAGIVESLTAEGNTEDNSVEESFTLHLPSAAAMKLFLTCTFAAEGNRNTLTLQEFSDGKTPPYTRVAPEQG
ncbi:hypothetical protein ACFS07_35455 [Undibacterium arcticum]